MLQVHHTAGRNMPGVRSGERPMPPSVPHSASRLSALQRTCGNRALMQMMRSRTVIQRKDDYYPDEGKEPHIHIHPGGMTYTGVGHNHKYIVRGDKVREPVVLEAYRELQALNTDRARQIIEWMRNRLGIEPPEEEQEEEQYYDENLPPEWVEQETAEHNPEGVPPPGFSFGTFTAK